jgi:hypothetical protein
VRVAVPVDDYEDDGWGRPLRPRTRVQPRVLLLRTRVRRTVGRLVRTLLLLLVLRVLLLRT